MSAGEHEAALDGQVHAAILRAIIDTGAAPSVEALAWQVGRRKDEVRPSLRRLHDGHGLVLHADGERVWVIHPFSCTPTQFWVEGSSRGWWSPCIWCAMGAATLVGGRARIHTRLGGEATPVVIDVRDGAVSPASLLGHFAVSVARAWDNVHHFCASTLVFDSEAAVETWCTRHGYARGAMVPIVQVLELAKAWYGKHLNPDWRKVTVQEAAAIFASCGLTGSTWDLPEGQERERY